MRTEYSGEFDESTLADNWLDQFATWFGDAMDAGLPEPNAMLLATASADGRPSARTVLLKGYDQRGFTFFTNYESRKGGDLAGNPRATLVFPWYHLKRQVIASGSVTKVSREETAEYFAVRPRGAQLGAWASPQSSVIGSRADLEQRLAEAERRFGDGAIEPPPHWGGFRVEPDEVEFWQGRQNRLHDRLRYTADGKIERLAP
ncbi:pyridoxamine 5'-phosphate oxidase [Dactylosporangium matsuzakiense]|uniref:Pyridoxine/pyridoxamine 5'-phosphate oxidase n=1 Tax=Dactylosporangium matsuzakiense TaxID=53360 RepID=A0A9W6KJX1_9ACTN|nr:pyridoxamine 5'-phosphate oxidase [Dactylosporangium matsuzakiense]UWZ44478.1 pyridoxamine 5'-phosphate oxidase [Dactylosporangium matsuzakiense]GLL01864.1 pyridoxine/pyridoxamine 5'-phosphate oxidase [Dactylosporangium matsuzakiense]